MIAPAGAFLSRSHGLPMRRLRVRRVKAVASFLRLRRGIFDAWRGS